MRMKKIIAVMAPLLIGISIVSCSMNTGTENKEPVKVGDTAKVGEMAKVGDTAKANDTINPKASTEPEDIPAFPHSFMIDSDNYYDYQDGMQCAAFSSAYVLRHFGEAAEGMDIFADFPNQAPDGGIFPEGIVNYFKGKGYQAEFRQNGTVAEIKGLVSQGVPVIVFIHTEEPHKTVHSTHYIPVVGYDEEYLYFAESIQGLANCENEENPVYNRKTELSKFERLWLNIDGVWDNPYFVIAKGDGGLS